MLNKLLTFVRRYEMIKPGDTVICAVSGGADSVALLWAMYLLRDKLQIKVEAAHFNHNLRGAESDRDARFVANLCDRYDIPLHMGSGTVSAGEKGLEAAARTARYTFFAGLSGKIATAHTADDNAETVLMHMIRGTGLKGLCGIMPVRDRIIRPMLSVTREEVLAFLEEYNLTFVEDSSNSTDQFFRNRLRHCVIPLLKAENPRFAQSITQMAFRLREDDQELERQALTKKNNDAETIRQWEKPVQNRILRMLLTEFGVPEPTAEHIQLLSDVLHSDCPSAKAVFPGNVWIGLVDGKLEKLTAEKDLEITAQIPGTHCLPGQNGRIVFSLKPTPAGFPFLPSGPVVIRSRCAGDRMRLHGGSKSLKKLFIDRKIPAACRNQIPVVADDKGVIAVCDIGGNLDRQNIQDGSIWVSFETDITLEEEK